MHYPLNLDGRRILITGAASGIGRATAVLVSRLSGSVAAVDQNREGLEQTVASLEGVDTRSTVATCGTLEVFRSGCRNWRNNGAPCMELSMPPGCLVLRRSVF